VSAATLARLRRLFSVLGLVSPQLAARVFLDRFARPGRRRLDAVDTATLATARRQRLDVGTDAIELYEWLPAAHAGSPATVCIVHGWGSHAPRFSALVDACLARGWRVLAFDAPAHGRSPGTRSSLMQFRTALDAVVDAHGPVDGLVAHSLGALAVTLRLADPAAPPPRAAVLIGMPRDASFLMELYLEALGAGPRVRAAVRSGFIRRYGLDIDELSGIAQAARIACPVLVVHDRDDESVPVAHARELLGLLPRGTLHETQGLGHNRLLRDPAALAVVVDFLKVHL
jgi:alpha-beta hydrolase superfamily lysophospholipase